MVIDATETLAEINESLIYVSESLRICKPERREAMLEMVDELLDAKNDKAIGAEHGHRETDCGLT
jgi:hypothetical protein